MGKDCSFDELDRIEKEKYAELQAIQSECDALGEELADAWESRSDEKIQELVDRIDEIKEQERAACGSWCDAQKNMLDKIFDEMIDDLRDDPNQGLDDEAE